MLLSWRKDVFRLMKQVYGLPYLQFTGLPVPGHVRTTPRPGRPLAHHSRRLLPSLASRRLTKPVSASAGSRVVEKIDDDELPFTIYTPTANADFWQQRPVAVVARGLEIAAAVARYMMEGRVTNRGASMQQLTDARADKLRHVLTQLGPAFVKIGQAISSRPDVAPPEFLRELEKLQDQIPPFCNEQAFGVIKAELGAPASQVFSSISPEAVAAASLGQVYRAVRRDTGEAVAVKVQRPGVALSIALDVYILRQVLAVVRRWRRFNSDLPALLDEWASSLFRELDYRHEAANGVRFRELYGHLEDVFVPRMHTPLCTRRVLVMEWVDGERLRTAYSAAREVGVGAAAPQTPSGSSDDLRLVEVGVRCSLEQIMEIGFYHADPHPGNLLRTRDGKLAYLDFGMMGSVDATIRRGLMRATLHLVNREFEALADDFVTLGMLPKAESSEEQGEVTVALTSVFAEALKGGVSNLSFGDLSGQLGRTMYQFQFRIPPYYTLLVRSLSVLEGIALASDRQYKVLGAAYPWIARRLLTDTTPELRSTLMALLYKDGRFNFSRMESLVSQAVRPTGRPQPRRSNGPSAAQRGDALALLLSPEGEFVRGIVTEELAKGIDAGWRLAADSVLGSARQQLLQVSELARGGSAGSASGSSLFLHALAESLSALPRLSDEQDQEQVEGITRLARVLQESTAGQRQQQGGDWFQEAAAAAGRTGSGTPLEAAAESLQTAAAILQWLAVEAETLTPTERAEALRLPIGIGQAVASRATARAIRWLLVGEALFNSSTAASEAETAAAARRAARASGAGGSSSGSAAAAAASSAAPSAQNAATQPGSRSSARTVKPGVSAAPSTSSSAGGSSGSKPGGSTAGATVQSSGRQATRMVPLSPSSRRPGSGTNAYRADSPGSTVIVRPTGTAAGPGGSTPAAPRSAVDAAQLPATQVAAGSVRQR